MAYDIDQTLINESGRIGPDFYRKTLYKGPWAGSLIKQESFPEGMGAEISVLTYDRVLPASALAWSAVTYNTGSGSNCVPSAQVITPAQTLRTYSLAQVALESAPLCVNDVRFSLNFQDQLSNVYKNLQQNTYYAWQDRYRDEYVRLSEHKVIAHTSALPEDDTAFPLTAATSRMTQGIADHVYLSLVREADEFAMGMVNGRPQFTMICSPEVSDNLVKTNSDIREDFRYAFMGAGDVNPLLKPLGVSFSYKGFYHLIDNFAPRWNFSGAWVRVLPYTTEATTQGTRYIVNPSYLTATHEDTIFFVRSVMVSLVPKPIGSAGGGVQFDPQAYRGEFKWLNIQDRTINPDKTIGFFRGLFMQGSKPIHPEHGWVVRHLRCSVPLGLVTCS